ncbi:MAG: hypothetical protein ACTHK6_06915 [Solirubrobacterales bacterium]
MSTSSWPAPPWRRLHAGLRVEVEAKETANGLLAKHVETPGGAGGGGGHDDGPNHT